MNQPRNQRAKLRVGIGILALLAVSFSFTRCSGKKEIWIYTSIYKEVIAELDPALHAAFPDISVKWYQAGSENVASKVNAELAAGKTQADLILTSDPFWYLELKKAGKLIPYKSPAAQGVPAHFADPDGAFTTVRIPVMVVGYNSESIKEAELPKTWKDLADPKWKTKLSVGNPLESGTCFSTVALLTKLYGWDYFAQLRKLDLVSAGGNSSVITRIETRERPMGIVLLENILKAMKKGSPVRPHYPQDGVIPVPSPIAILQNTEHPEIARKIYDWFFSEAAQKAIVSSGMYSPLATIPSPDKAKPWKELEGNMVKWSNEILNEIYASREQIKAKFSEVVLH